MALGGVPHLHAQRGGNGKGSFADPRRVGWGWNPYDLVTTLGDWDGDKRADLVARLLDVENALMRRRALGPAITRDILRYVESRFEHAGAADAEPVRWHAPGARRSDGSGDRVRRRGAGRLVRAPARYTDSSPEGCRPAMHGGLAERVLRAQQRRVGRRAQLLDQRRHIDGLRGLGSHERIELELPRHVRAEFVHKCCSGRRNAGHRGGGVDR